MKPFCAMLAKCNRSCAARLEKQKKINDLPGTGARTVTCFAGLRDSAVPLQAGESSPAEDRADEAATYDATADDISLAGISNTLG
jgi:hypothetical protein